MPRPFIVKPVDEGSTIGVKVVADGANRDWGDDWTFGEQALVEEYIRGRELTVGIMGERALAVTEIRFEGTAFDYTAKYTAGHAEHVLPAPIPTQVYDAAMDAALTAHRSLSKPDHRRAAGKGKGPASEFRHGERPRRRRQQGAAIAPDIAGEPIALIRLVQAFDTKGVNHNILAGRQKSDRDSDRHC
ncbi:MAG: hypothetical protein ACKO9A_11045 [Alphaproteobacteria bacterium]